MKCVRMDKLGRIVIPATFRKILGFRAGSALEVCPEEDRVIVRHSSACCKLCYASIDNRKGVGLCQSCIEKIKKI